MSVSAILSEIPDGYKPSPSYSSFWLFSLASLFTPDHTVVSFNMSSARHLLANYYQMA